MMSTAQRHLPSLCLILLVATLLVGCGQEDDRVRIRIWHTKDSADRLYLEQKVAEYNAQHDDRVVETLYYETEDLRRVFIIASVGGEGPEIAYTAADDVSTFAVTGATRPLDDVFPESFFDEFAEDGIITYQGERRMIADQIGSFLAFVYNKDLMPEPPGTLDLLIAIGQELTKDLNGDGRPDQYGLTWNYTEPFFFIPFLTSFGGWVMDENGNPTLDNAATAEAVQYVLDLRDEHGIIPRESDYNTAESLFKNGAPGSREPQRAAAIINGPWAFGGYTDLDMNIGIARIPYNTETGRWSAPMVAARGYSINANVTDEELPYVRDVIEYLTSAEVQTYAAENLSIVPTRKAVRMSPVVQDNPLLQASLEQVEVGRAMPLEPQMRQIWDGMRGPYQLVMNGAVSAEEGARLMQQEVEKRIADTYLDNSGDTMTMLILPLIGLLLLIAAYIGYRIWKARRPVEAMA